LGVYNRLGDYAALARSVLRILSGDGLTKLRSEKARTLT